MIDVSGRFVMPGLRDLHVHSMVNAPPAGPLEMLGSDVIHVAESIEKPLFGTAEMLLKLRKPLPQTQTSE